FKVVTAIEVIKYVPCRSSLSKAAMAHIMLAGWLVLYTILRTLASFVSERLVAQDILSIVRGLFKRTEPCGDVLVRRCVYVPAFGWVVVSSAEKVGNYFIGVRR
ncbi:hypothetical protein HOY80DRAFT_877560, partial [Tuber brumale]